MTRTLVAVVLAALVAVGCGADRQLIEEAEPTGTETVGDIPTNADPGEEFGEDVQEFSAILDVDDDQLSDGTAVTIAQASIDPAPGWVVIFTDEAGAPAAVIGKHQLEAALEDITVVLDTTLEPGQHELWAQIHVDAEPVGDLQWPGRDLPVTREGDDVVQAEFTAIVQE